MFYKIKLKRPHPRKAFQLGRHVVGPVEKTYELNEVEVKELKTKGCQHWLEHKLADKPADKPVVEAPASEVKSKK